MNSEEDKDVQPWHSYEPMDQYDSLFPLLPDFVPHYTIGGDRFPQIALASKHDLQLRRQLLATLIADRMQIGIAYADKRYAKDSAESRWLGLTDRIDSIYKEGRDFLGWYLSLHRDEIATDNSKSFRELSWQFFYRTVGSLDAAKRLSELGYLCEVATILRSALEQFSFCAKLLSLSGSEDLKKIKPIHSLNHFKQFVPAAGPLYGLLSKYTHFEYDHHTHFFSYSPSQIQTIRRGPVLRAYATQLLFNTMACVARYILAEAPTQFKAVPKSVQDIDTFVMSVDRYSDDVCNMLPRDEVLANMDILLQDIVRSRRARP
jgi:hypothetical protein